jgi:hypothetical protein
MLTHWADADNANEKAVGALADATLSLKTVAHIPMSSMQPAPAVGAHEFSQKDRETDIEQTLGTD